MMETTRRAISQAHDALRHPTIIVFVLGCLGAFGGWVIRQEIINSSQQAQIDAITRERIGAVALERRFNGLENRMDNLEKHGFGGGLPKK